MVSAKCSLFRRYVGSKAEELLSSKTIAKEKNSRKFSVAGKSSLPDANSVVPCVIEEPSDIYLNGVMSRCNYPNQGS